MTENIGPNRYQLFGKLILQIVLIGILSLLIFVTIHPTGNPQPSWVFPVFGCFFLLLNIVIFIQILRLPIGASIDIKSKSIVIKYLFLPSKYIQTEDIESYNSTIIFTKSSQYEGLLINLSAKRKILLSDFNLKDYSYIKSFLEE